MTRFKIGKLPESKYDVPYFRWFWVDVDTPRHAVENYLREHEYVYASDNCGDDDYFFAVGVDGEFKFYRVHHDWSWYNYGQEDSNLENTFEITEISEKEARESCRVWVVV